MQTIGKCELCGGSLYSGNCGKCSSCQSRLWNFMQDGTFYFPSELRGYVSSPMWLQHDDALGLAMIRADRLYGKLLDGQRRTEMQIGIAVATEPRTDEEAKEEDNYIREKLIPKYRKIHESRLTQLLEAMEQNRQLAELRAERHSS